MQQAMSFRSSELFLILSLVQKEIDLIQSSNDIPQQTKHKRLIAAGSMERRIADALHLPDNCRLIGHHPKLILPSIESESEIA